MVKVPHLSDEELDDVIAFLRSDDELVAATDTPAAGASRPSLLVKVLSHAVMKPLPFPTMPVVAPLRTDAVAYGRYLVFSRDCYASDVRTRASNPRAAPVSARRAPRPSLHGQARPVRRAFGDEAGHSDHLERLDETLAIALLRLSFPRTAPPDLEAGPLDLDGAVIER